MARKRSTVHHVGVSDIARWFGVRQQAVSNWLVRFPDFPVADVSIGDGPQTVRGWLPGREAEIRQWREKHPSIGGHGGRPPKTPDHTVAGRRARIRKAGDELRALRTKEKT